MADDRAEIRAQRIAMAAAQKQHTEYFNPEEWEDAYHASRAIMRAAERAAYEAIKQEREHHAHEMAMLQRRSNSTP